MTAVVLQVSRMHHPVTVLGYGTRLGLWVQGCTLACLGCVSRDTWESDPSTAMSVDDVAVAAAILVGDGPLDGITISGGEPFQQAPALQALLARVADDPRLGAADVDVLAYSGYPWEELVARHTPLLGMLDAVIPEPYDARRPAGGPLRGSDNQRIVTLSELGRQRYTADGPVDGGGRPRIQLAADADGIWMIGVPGRGDMAKVEQLARARGLRLQEVSWRP
jgi:anaerobic ribonucleoside-triphosphate reductase activating protein